MTCPHLPGVTGFLLRQLVLASTALALVLSQPLAAEAAPSKATAASGAKAAKSTKASANSAKPKSGKTAGKSTTKKAGSGKAATPACPQPTRQAKAAKGRKRQPAPVCKSGPGKAASVGAAAAAPAAAAALSASSPTAPAAAESPSQGLRLPLMLRTVPSLPDSPAALQARLDSIVAAQGDAAQGAQASGVRQLAPDIYAFSLQCADAEQCQRLRLAIEKERDWVAGLQLDERRHIPRPPERSSPAAR